MAGTKEIKNRIGSVRETRKITHAMHLIASTKLRKARTEPAIPAPISRRCGDQRIFRTASDVDSSTFIRWMTPLPGGHQWVPVITADKGLRV